MDDTRLYEKAVALTENAHVAIHTILTVVFSGLDNAGRCPDLESLSRTKVNALARCAETIGLFNRVHVERCRECALPMPHPEDSTLCVECTHETD